MAGGTFRFIGTRSQTVGKHMAHAVYVVVYVTLLRLYSLRCPGEEGQPFGSPNVLTVPLP